MQPGGAHHRADLVPGERQLGPAELGAPALAAQPTQPQPGLVATDRDDVRAGAEVVHDRRHEVGAEAATQRLHPVENEQQRQEPARIHEAHPRQRMADATTPPRAGPSGTT